MDEQSFDLYRSDDIERLLDLGVSFDLDILPAIKDTVQNAQGKQFISRWKYFRRPILQRHSRRLRETKVAPSRFASSPNFNTEDKPLDPEHVRNRAVAEWREKIRPKMEANNE